VTVVARVSTALPWQKGQMAGRAPPSESGIVILFSAARVEWDEFDGLSEQEAIVSSSRRFQSCRARRLVQLVV